MSTGSHAMKSFVSTLDLSEVNVVFSLGITCLAHQDVSETHLSDCK